MKVVAEVSCRCPYCDNSLDEVTAAVKPGGQPRLPREGEPSICGDCGGVLVFNGDQTLRKASPAEHAYFMSNVTFRRLVEGISRRRRRQQN